VREPRRSRVFRGDLGECPRRVVNRLCSSDLSRRDPCKSPHSSWQGGRPKTTLVRCGVPALPQRGLRACASPTYVVRAVAGSNPRRSPISRPVPRLAELVAGELTADRGERRAARSRRRASHSSEARIAEIERALDGLAGLPRPSGRLLRAEQPADRRVLLRAQAGEEVAGERGDAERGGERACRRGSRCELDVAWGSCRCGSRRSRCWRGSGRRRVRRSSGRARAGSTRRPRRSAADGVAAMPGRGGRRGSHG
jgi:hypothetical protein